MAKMLTKQQVLFIRQAAKKSLKDGEISAVQYARILKKTADELEKQQPAIDRDLIQKANSKFSKMQLA
jgi:hypothetical protein